MREVYKHDGLRVKRMLRKIKDEEHGSFTNMPRNVLMDSVLDPHQLINRNYADFTVDLLTNIATRYSEYTFWVNTVLDGDKKGYMKHMYVFNDEECLGKIDWSYYNDSMEFRNERVNADIQRGDCKKTSKISTAKNIFSRYFYPLTLYEEMEAVELDVMGALSDHTWSLKRGRDDASRDIIEVLTTMLRRETPELLEFVRANGMSKQLESKAKDKEAIAITNSLNKSIEDSKGQFIFLKESMYYSAAAGKVRRMKRDDLSEDVLTAIGLLKIAENNTAIDGVGYKATADKFYITEELNFDFDE